MLMFNIHLQYLYQDAIQIGVTYFNVSSKLLIFATDCLRDHCIPTDDW